MKKSKLVCTLLAATALSIGAIAEAAPIIRLFDGTTTVEVADQQVLPTPDVNPAVGAVTFIGTIGNWVTNVTTGISSSPTPSIDLNSINASNIGVGGTFLDIFLTDTNFVLAGLASLGNFIGTIGGTTDGMVTWWLHIDDGNTPFAQTTQIGTGTYGGPAFAAAFADVASVDGTFSLTLQVRINHNNLPNSTIPDLTSFDFRGIAVPVPEPGTILLLGVGLLGAALVRRHRP